MKLILLKELNILTFMDWPKTPYPAICLKKLWSDSVQHLWWLLGAPKAEHTTGMPNTEA